MPLFIYILLCTYTIYIYIYINHLTPSPPEVYRMVYIVQDIHYLILLYYISCNLRWKFKNIQLILSDWVNVPKHVSIYISAVCHNSDGKLIDTGDRFLWILSSEFWHRLLNDMKRMHNNNIRTTICIHNNIILNIRVYTYIRGGQTVNHNLSIGRERYHSQP